jgi:hypothetical protein
MSEVERKKGEVVDALVSMGFPENHSRRALDHINPLVPQVRLGVQKKRSTACHMCSCDQAVELCLAWLVEHPITEELKFENLEAQAAVLQSMGFSRCACRLPHPAGTVHARPPRLVRSTQAVQALEKFHFNMERASDYLLANLQRAEEERRRREEEEKRRQEELEIKRQARLEAQRKREAEAELKISFSPPDQLRFGFVLALKAECSLALLDTASRDVPHVRSDVVTEACHLVIVNPNTPQDDGVVCGQSDIALRTADGCYLGVDADGRVNAMSREVGPFVRW